MHISSVVHIWSKKTKNINVIPSFPLRIIRRYFIITNYIIISNFQLHVVLLFCFKMHASPGPLHYGKIMAAESASQPITVRHHTGNDDNNKYYYLFKKFLVSDWLTANCEIVISTQWLTKYGFFTFILAK